MSETKRTIWVLRVLQEGDSEPSYLTYNTEAEALAEKHRLLTAYWESWSDEPAPDEIEEIEDGINPGDCDCEITWTTLPAEPECSTCDDAATEPHQCPDCERGGMAETREAFEPS